jgi:2,3-bisphosphoglycerate-independent phosphoglycerate mutase
VKYCVVIIDGASGWPLPDHGGQTCLELASTPNLTALAKEGLVGMARTVPEGMEPSSACACMSVMGYDPRIYYRGRSAIEAISMGVPFNDQHVLFRCNLVAVQEGKMRSYSSGYITTEEAHLIIETLNEKLGTEQIRFYPGTGYRHICRLAGHEEALQATCTPPHDISDKPVAGHLPRGNGSQLLNDLMERSEEILKEHPVNLKRQAKGDIPATTIWLFWSSGKIPSMPSFKGVFNLSAAMTSGVDLLRGLAKMAGMEVLQIAGVTDGQDNDYVAQVDGALRALEKYDLVTIHIEAPDEAGHDGSVEHKVKAIEQADREVISKLRSWKREALSLLVMPDHPTPIKIKTHVGEPVPFLLWGPGFKPSGAIAFTEAQAKKSGIYIDDGYTIMKKFTKEA